MSTWDSPHWESVEVVQTPSDHFPLFMHLSNFFYSSLTQLPFPRLRPCILTHFDSCLKIVPGLHLSLFGSILPLYSMDVLTPAHARAQTWLPSSCANEKNAP